MPLYVTIPLCIAAALAIAFGVYGAFALWDFYQLNKRNEDE
jgi:hypothetical protein